MLFLTILLSTYVVFLVRFFQFYNFTEVRGKQDGMKIVH